MVGSDFSTQCQYRNISTQLKNKKNRDKKRRKDKPTNITDEKIFRQSNKQKRYKKKDRQTH